MLMSNISILTMMLAAEIPAIVMLSGMDFLSMSLWGTVAFFFSTVLYSVNLDYMGRDILPETVAIIQSALMVTYLGEFVGGKLRIRFFKKNNNGNAQISKEIAGYSEAHPSNRPILANKTVTLILCVFILSFAAFYYRVIYNGASSVYANINPVAAIAAARGLAHQKIIIIDWWINICTYCVISFSYVYLFYFIYNSVACNKRKLYILVPALLSFIVIVVSSSRSNALPFFFIAICQTYLMLRQKNMPISPVVTKFLKYIILSMGFLALFFFGFGRLVRNQPWTFYELFMKYFVSSIYGLDEYMRYPWDPMPIWGLATFREFLRQIDKIYSVGYDFSAPLGESVKHFFRYSQGTMSSNIATALAGGLHDLGFFGMLFYRFFIASIYGALNQYVQSRRDMTKHVYATIMLGWLLQVAFLLPIADRFAVFLSPSFVWMSLFIFVGNWFYRLSTKKIRFRI